jgi:hypothetical protein
LVCGQTKFACGPYKEITGTLLRERALPRGKKGHWDIRAFITIMFRPYQMH